ncbi:hypothetical protein L9F63_004247, partial [Diploptera punctata]
VVFMPVTDNVLAVYQDDAMQIWKLDDFECAKQILPETWKVHHIKTIAFTRDGRGMVIGGHSPSLVVFSLDLWSVQKVIELPDSVSGVRHIEFLPQLFDASILGLLSSHCTLYFMDIETSTLLKNVFVPQSNITKFSCSSNGKFIACVLQSGEVNIYTSSQLLETRSPDEPVAVEKVETMHSPDLPETDNSKKIAAQHKNKEILKKNLLKVHKQIKETLDLNRLKPILKEFGEYPECYRSLIWKAILQLPGNQASYVSLVKKDIHHSYANLEVEYPLENKTALKNLKRLLSCMTHWSPVFSEAKFLPLFVFPFVKVFQNDPFVCFEAVVTIFLNWCQHWFEYFPFPPINVLSMIENVLTEHDLELLKFYYEYGVKSHLYAWTLLETAFSEVLSRSEWLCLWDHILSNEPAFLLMAVVAYNIICRKAIMSCRTYPDFEYFFHNQNPVDMKRLLSKTYTLCEKTSTEVHPRQYLVTFKPLEEGSYPVFNKYPKFIVDYKARHLEKLRKEEETIKKQIDMALNHKVAQERRLKEQEKTELKEKRLRELEEVYCEMLAKEETRITEQHKKLLDLRKELQTLEDELCCASKNRMMQKNVEERHLNLSLLLQDIERKRTLQEVELLAAEKEIQHHLKDISAHKHNLKQKLGAANSSAVLCHHDLQQKQNKLTEELRKVMNVEAETKKLQQEMIYLLGKLKDQKEGSSEAGHQHRPKPCQTRSQVDLDSNLWKQDPVKAAMNTREELLKSSEINIKNGEIEKSAIAAHSLLEGHRIEKEAKLLKHLEKPLDLTVWEKIFIQKNKFKSMNFDISDERNLISKFIESTPDGNDISKFVKSTPDGNVIEGDSNEYPVVIMAVENE